MDCSEAFQSKVFGADRSLMSISIFRSAGVGGSCRAWLHEFMVRDARTGLPVRFPCSPGQDRRPCAQIIYCRDVGDFIRLAGPIGRFLAPRGLPLVIVDANGPIPGLIGTYHRDRPKYFKGLLRPRLGDLAYTEYALFGL